MYRNTHGVRWVGGVSICTGIHMECAGVGVPVCDQYRMSSLLCPVYPTRKPSS